MSCLWNISPLHSSLYHHRLKIEEIDDGRLIKVKLTLDHFTTVDTMWANLKPQPLRAPLSKSQKKTSSIIYMKFISVIFNQNASAFNCATLILCLELQ